MTTTQLETLTAAAQTADLLVRDIREARKACSNISRVDILGDQLDDAARIHRILKNLAALASQPEPRDPQATAITPRIDGAMAKTEIRERSDM